MNPKEKRKFGIRLYKVYQNDIQERYEFVPKMSEMPREELREVRKYFLAMIAKIDKIIEDGQTDH